MVPTEYSLQRLGKGTSMDREEAGGAAGKQALVPLRKQTVDFYGDQVLAVLVEEGGEQHVYVPLRPIVEYLGLTWPSQTLRLRRDPVLAAGSRIVFITKTNPREPGNPNMLCLPLDLLPGWLFGITTSKVRPDLADK